MSSKRQFPIWNAVRTELSWTHYRKLSRVKGEQARHCPGLRLTPEMTNPIPTDNPLFSDVRHLIDAARQRVASAVNAELTQLYWQVGRRISSELLQGQRAEYGKQVIAELARMLTSDFGKGWSERQLRYCLRVADIFPAPEILHTVCSQLSWSHLRLIIQIDDPLKRDFYLEICRLERWSVRQRFLHPMGVRT